MTALDNFLLVIELSDPGLYDVLDGDEARRELEVLVSQSQIVDRSTLVVVFGEPQRIVNVETIGARKERGGWCLEVPVVIVERKWTTPPKQSLTKAKTG